MKYFSPNILDGSVTTAKIADGAVTGVKIVAGGVGFTKFNSVITSQGGSISGSGLVVVSLSDHTFFADFEAANVTSGRMGPFTAAIPAANAAAPQVQLHNPDGPARLYDVEWRHVNA